MFTAWLRAAINKRAIGDANAITYLSEALSTHLARAEQMRYVVNCLKTLAERDGTSTLCLVRAYLVSY